MRARSRARSSSCSRTGRRAARSCGDIREAEHEGDRLTHEVINLLNRTFVTPFDRDDMYRLASVIDDVCDHVDEAADNIDAYEVRDVPEKARQQAEVIYRAASRLHEAVELLEGFKDSKRQLFALRELEDEGDRLVARGDRRPLPLRGRPADDHPLEGHPRAARGSRRRVRERRRRPRGDPRQEPVTLLVITIVVALAVRLHERLPRHGERGRDVGLDARALAAARRADRGDREPRRRVRDDRRREDGRQGDHRHRPRDREDGARRRARRDRLEPAHVVARAAVVVVARADRRPGRRRARAVGREGRPVARDRAQGR